MSNQAAPFGSSWFHLKDSWFHLVSVGSIWICFSVFLYFILPGFYDFHFSWYCKHPGGTLVSLFGSSLPPRKPGQRATPNPRPPWQRSACAAPRRPRRRRSCARRLEKAAARRICAGWVVRHRAWTTLRGRKNPLIPFCFSSSSCCVVCVCCSSGTPL